MERPSENVSAAAVELTEANLTLLNNQALEKEREREMEREREQRSEERGGQPTLRKSVTALVSDASGPASTSYTSAWVRSVSEQNPPLLLPPPASMIQNDDVVCGTHRGANVQVMGNALYSAAGLYRGLQTAVAASGSQTFNAQLLERQDSQQQSLYRRTDSQQQLVIDGPRHMSLSGSGLRAGDDPPVGLALGATPGPALVRTGSISGWSTKVRDVTERVRTLDRLERLDHLEDVLARGLVLTACSSAQCPLPTSLTSALFDRALVPLVRELLHFGADLGAQLSGGAQVRCSHILLASSRCLKYCICVFT